MTAGDATAAIHAFLRAVNLNPALTQSWTMLERLYRATGEPKGAVAAHEQVLMLENLPPEIVRAGSLFSDGDLASAEEILSAYLNKVGNHVEAFRLLARIKQQCKALDDAERLLEAALQIAPNYRAARLDYVRVLLDGQRYLQAHEVAGSLVELEPDNRDLLSLYAAGVRWAWATSVCHRRLSAAGGGSTFSAELHVALGHSLKTWASRTKPSRRIRRQQMRSPVLVTLTGALQI